MSLYIAAEDCEFGTTEKRSNSGPVQSRITRLAV